MCIYVLLQAKGKVPKKKKKDKNSTTHHVAKSGVDNEWEELEISNFTPNTFTVLNQLSAP